MTLDLKSTDLNRSKFTEENVVKLKDRFPQCDDETLARYLIAQNNDVEGAATKLLKAEDLKTEYWHIRKSQCINEIKTGTAYLHGTDKEGRPLLVIHARLHDPDTRNLKEMIQMTLWWTEQALSKLPEDKSQFVILLDRDNCENALDTEYLQKVAEIFQDLHPERLHKAIVYPTGYVYYSMWNLVLKWFMDEHTRSKVLPAMSLDDVFEFFDETFVPAALGGKCAYVFNPDDFLDPIYPEDALASLSSTTEESLCNGGGATLVPPFSDPIVPEGSFETHNSFEAPPMSPAISLVSTTLTCKKHTVNDDPYKMEELSECKDTDVDPNRNATTTTRQGVPSPIQRPVTPTKGLLTVSPLSSNPDLLALVGTPRSLSVPLPLPLPASLVEEGWQEYVEYEQSQHSSPTHNTNPSSSSSTRTPGSTRQAERGQGGDENTELFSPATVYNDDSEGEEDEEGVWNDVDSVSSRRNSISQSNYNSTISNEVDLIPQRSTRPPLPPSQSMRIPVPVPVRVPVPELEHIDSVLTFSGSVDFEGESYMYNNNTNPARVRTILFPPSRDVHDDREGFGIDVDVGGDIERYIERNTEGEMERYIEAEIEGVAGREIGLAEVPDSEEGDDCADLWHEVSSVSGGEDGDGEDGGEERDYLEGGEGPGELSPLTTGGDSVFSASTTAATTLAAGTDETRAVSREGSARPGSNRAAAPVAPPLPKDHSLATAYAQLAVVIVFASALVVFGISLVRIIFSPSAPVPLSLLAQLIVFLGLLLSFV